MPVRGVALALRDAAPAMAPVAVARTARALLCALCGAACGRAVASEVVNSRGRAASSAWWRARWASREEDAGMAREALDEAIGGLAGWVARAGLRVPESGVAGERGSPTGVPEASICAEALGVLEMTWRAGLDVGSDGMREASRALSAQVRARGTSGDSWTRVIRHECFRYSQALWRL